MYIRLNKINSFSLYCQTVYKLVAALLVAIPLMGQAADSTLDYEMTVSKLVWMAEAQQTEILHSNRNHKIYLHGRKQKCVVLQLHGLFQSPLDQRGVSDYFFKKGCNVVAPLLPGHWQRNESAFHQLSHSDWIRQTQELVELALNLSENLILVGHSAGGLLAFNIAYQHPERVKALILFSPALQLTPKTVFLTRLGHLFNLSRRGKTGIDHDYDNYKKPACAGVLLMQLNRSIFGPNDDNRQLIYQNFKTPTLIFSTEDDDVISHRTLVDFQKANPKIVSLYSYPQGTGVFHDNIQRGPLDGASMAPLAWQNPFYDKLLLEMSHFLHPLITP